MTAPLTPIYPPSTTNPADTATPTRTTALNTRGTILVGIQATMEALQQLYPRRIFPTNPVLDQSRLPEVDPLGWRRGGTSPAGASLGGTPGGSYFVGSAEKWLLDAAPQRIVWEPPQVGEELLMPLSMVGPYKDPRVQQLPNLLTPLNPATPEHFRYMGAMAAAQWALRIIPMRVHLWASDFDDCDELVHWFAAAVQTSFNGNINGMDVFTPGGYRDIDKDTRGIHYECTVRFAAPLHYPYFAEVEAKAAALRFSGAAPDTVVG